MSSQEVHLHFKGPFKFTPGPTCIFTSALANVPCVYLWTFRSKIDGRFYIHYVGEALRLGPRHKQHLSAILGLSYAIFDTESAKNGTQTRIWPGLWREKGTDGPLKQLATYETIGPKVLEYVREIDIFIAETHVGTQLRKHLEGSVGWNLRNNHKDLKALYPDDNHVGTMANRPGIILRITSDENIAGLDAELKI